MIDILWIGENPKATSTSSLMGWPVCKKLAELDFNITYLAVDVFSPPYQFDNINIIHPIIQDQSAPYGLGSVQNMFNIIYKRAFPDVVVICLNRIKTKEILFQLDKIGYKNIIVWSLTNQFHKDDYGDIELLHSLNWKGKTKKVIYPLINPLPISNKKDNILYIDRDYERFELSELHGRWINSEFCEKNMIWILDYMKNNIRPEVLLSEMQNEKIAYRSFTDQGIISQKNEDSIEAKYFYLPSLNYITTVGAIECLLSGLEPVLYDEKIDTFKFQTTEFDFLNFNDRDAAENLNYLFCENENIEKWVSLLNLYRKTQLIQKQKITGINFKGHIWGNGSMSLTTRLLASAINSIGDVDVSLENTTTKQPDECILIQDQEELNKLVQFEKKKINPNQYVHIRYSGPQSSEQHLLEGLFDYTIGKKNIAYWSIDYSSLGGPGCPSASLLNKIPEQIWVPSFHSKMALVNSDVIEDKIKIVPNGYFDNIFTDNHKAENKKSKFVFLNISNFKFYLRKGIDILLESYIKAFDKKDDVQLLLQSQSTANISIINKLITTFKARYQHDPEIVIKTQPLSQKELAAIYHLSDCLVFPSRGESFGLPPLEAMGCKKTVIVTNWGGMMDFCNESNAYLIDYDLEPVRTWQLQGWGGGFQANPKLDCLTELMWHVYQHPVERDKKATCAYFDAKKWTWYKAAHKAKDIILQL